MILLSLEKLLFGHMLVASFPVSVIVLFNLKDRCLHIGNVKFFVVHSIAGLGMDNEILGIVATKVWSNFGFARVYLVSGSSAFHHHEVGRRLQFFDFLDVLASICLGNFT
jgi:hypothetical protein